MRSREEAPAGPCLDQSLSRSPFLPLNDGNSHARLQNVRGNSFARGRSFNTFSETAKINLLAVLADDQHHHHVYQPAHVFLEPPAVAKRLGQGDEEMVVVMLTDGVAFRELLERIDELPVRELFDSEISRFRH